MSYVNIIISNTYFRIVESSIPEKDIKIVDKIEEIFEKQLQYANIQDQYSSLSPDELKATLLRIQETSLISIANNLDSKIVSLYAPKAHAFHIAAKRGHVKAIEILRHNKELLNLPYDKTNTALFLASERGHKDVVVLLLQSGANVNQHCSYQLTALLIATYTGQDEIIRLLLGAGADIEKKVNGRTALNIATEMGNKKSMELLLNSNADLDGSFNSTPLTTAVIRCNEEMLELLTNAGVNVNNPIMYNRVALHYAIEKKNKGIVKKLLEAGHLADKTALYLAAESGCEDTAALLMQCRTIL